MQEEEKNYMYDRAISTDPEEVADYVEYVTNEYKAAKVLSCLKHYRAH